MVYVIAKLEKSARARLSWIQSFAASFGIVPRPIYGHITLATLEDRDAAAAACGQALADQGAFTVDFEKVEVLDDRKTIAAVAARQGTLEAIHEKLAPGGEDWIPCTILLQDPMVNMNWVRTAMAGMFQPFTAKVERIELMEGSEIVGGFDLKGETV